LFAPSFPETRTSEDRLDAFDFFHNPRRDMMGIPLVVFTQDWIASRDI